MERPMPPTRPVLHVLPGDLDHSAQAFARELRNHLDGRPVPHRTLTLFAGSPGALDPDYTLGADPGLLRRAGYAPRVVTHLRRAIDHLDPEVIVAHGGEPLKYCAPAKPAGTRLIYYKIGSSEGRVRRRLHAGWHRRFMRKADHVVTVSDDLATEAVTLFEVDPTKIVTIPEGRRAESFYPTCHADPSVGLVHLSPMTPSERPDWFIELIRRLAREGLPIHGTMAGDGPLLDEVRCATARLPIDVLGRLHPEQVPGLLSAAQILIFTGRRTDEGMPGIFVEAGLSGLPVVTTAVAGAGTVIQQGATGYITPVNDIDQLAERARELVLDAERRAAMGRAAHRRCLRRFTLDAVGLRWAELLHPRTPQTPPGWRPPPAARTRRRTGPPFDDTPMRPPVAVAPRAVYDHPALH